VKQWAPHVALLALLLLTAGQINPTRTVSSSTFLAEVSKGNVPGHSLVRKFARNPGVINAEEDVWQTGGAHVHPTSAGVVVLAHGGNDVSGGSGARKVMVECLAASTWLVATEEVTLGAGPTTSTTMSCIRTYRGYVTDAGTYAQTYASPYGTNDGSIVAAIGANNQWTIAAGMGQTLLSHYTIPAGKTGHLIDIHAKVETAKVVEFFFYQRRNADDASAPVTGRRVVHAFVDSSSDGSDIDSHYVDVFPAKTDLWATAIGPAGSARVDFQYDILLVDDGY